MNLNAGAIKYIFISQINTYIIYIYFFLTACLMIQSFTFYFINRRIRIVFSFF